MLTELIPDLVTAEVVAHAIQEGGILDWVNDLMANTETLLKSAVIVAGLGGVLWFAIKAKFSMIGIVTALLAAMLLIGGALNIEALADLVGVEFRDGGGNASGVVQLESPTATAGTSPAQVSDSRGPTGDVA